MTEEELNANGPIGSLAGTLSLPSLRTSLDDTIPVLLIVPGSGPTDRDGNSPLGISASMYRLLANALASRGIPSVRIDKRGMFGSKNAIPDANDVTVKSYGDDVLAWISAIRTRFPRTDGEPRRVVPVGHSEGGLVVLAAAERIPDPSGLILIASPGRPLADVLLEQLRANPANTPIFSQAQSAITALKKAERVVTDDLDPALASLFADAVQSFLIDLFSYDPVALIRNIDVPVLILQGECDLQVSVKDAQALGGSAKSGVVLLMPEVNHVLKSVLPNDLEANVMTYSNPRLPLASIAVDAVIEFLSDLHDEHRREPSD